jgi:hypothetical protein
MSYERLHRGPDRADPEALDDDPRGRSPRPGPGKRTLSEVLEPAVQLVQRRVRAAAPEADPVRVQAAAQRGIAGPSERLPHLDRIQRLFGRHDVGAVQAHVGEGATAASDAMGAAAYATGNHIAFGGAPDLHTAAHEAAHVVQQRAGIHLKAGVGESHDEHERHADAVADLVVTGQSAEGLLDRYRSPGAAAPAVQRAVKAQKPSTAEVKNCNTLGSLAGVFSLNPDGVKAFGAQMKTRMFATAVFPQPYKDQFDTNPAVKEEIEAIIKGLNDLIAASTSGTVIAVAANQGAALADALFGIIGGGITADYVRGKDTPHYKMLALGLAGDGATNYLTFVQTKRAKLVQYKAAIHEDRFDAESRSTNALNQNRIDELTAKAAEIENELTTKLTEHANLDATLAKVTAFQADIAPIEAAIDLDFKVDDRAIQNQLRTLQGDETAHNSYRPGGGVEDGVSVSDGYVVGLARLHGGQQRAGAAQDPAQDREAEEVRRGGPGSADPLARRAHTDDGRRPPARRDHPGDPGCGRRSAGLHRGPDRPRAHLCSGVGRRRLPSEGQRRVRLTHRHHEHACIQGQDDRRDLAPLAGPRSRSGRAICSIRRQCSNRNQFGRHEAHRRPIAGSR